MKLKGVGINIIEKSRNLLEIMTKIIRHTRVNGSSDDPAKWIPCSVIKPIMKGIKSFFGQESRRPVVKVGIKFVDDALEAEDGEQTHGESCENEDRKSEI